MSERIERQLWLAASPEDVWDVVTGADWLADDVTLDLRPGGDAAFRFGRVPKSGSVDEARGPSRLLLARPQPTDAGGSRRPPAPETRRPAPGGWRGGGRPATSRRRASS